jgi:uncharacterized membrane protein YqjE
MTDVIQGPATNLLRSLVHFGGALLGLAHTRIELLLSEIDEDLERGLRILLWALMALLAGSLGVLLSGLTVMIYFWDTHRLAAAFGVTAVFLLAAILAGITFRTRLHEKPRLLDATRTELQRDVVALRSDP